MPAGPLFGTPHKRQTPGACLFFMPAWDFRALHKGEIFMEKIGMIGLGIMGCPIAKNLCAAGADLTVFDLDQQRVEQLKALGASAGSYADIARTCDVILMILPNGSISKQVLFGEGGLASALTPGKLVCDMSSVTPGESRACHEGLAKLGVGFVDAPVSGGETGAIAGTLAIMCGGSQADFQRLKPVFHIIGSSALLVGGPGSGSTTKLANQIIVNLNIAALSEALVFAAKAGVDPMMVFQAIRGGLAGSAVMESKAPSICARNFTPGGTIKINHKDIGNVLASAHELDVPVPFTAQLYELQQTLKAWGDFGDDHGAYVKYFEALAGIQVSSPLAPGGEGTKA